MFNAQVFKKGNRLIRATGGTVTQVGAYTIHTFLSSSSFSVLSTPVNGVIDVLVVAGGGGGVTAGGGAGGLLYSTSYPISRKSYTVTVGNGGAGKPTDTGPAGDDGQNSVFDALTAIGGGGGAGDSTPGRNGGSGGGGKTYGTAIPPGAGTAGQGYAGGNSVSDASPYPGAGGGGAGAVGGNCLSNLVAGTGGVGLSIDISGTPTFYAGGGGGAPYAAGGTAGNGGNGGGGNGNSAGGGSAGTANTGGGGGAGSQSFSGAAGGSGIIIIRYLT